MYGFKEARVIAFDQLVRKLDPFGYETMPLTDGLWGHKTKMTAFTICADNFGVQYLSKQDAKHLINAIKFNYECTIEWKGKTYCGTTIGLNCPQCYIDTSIPVFVPKVLNKFNHIPPNKPEHSPHEWTSPIYGRTNP